MKRAMLCLIGPLGVATMVHAMEPLPHNMWPISQYCYINKRNLCESTGENPCIVSHCDSIAAEEERCGPTGLSNAIHTRRLLEFNYNGKRRIVEPHINGISNGTQELLTYQVGGSSESGGLPGWRRFKVYLMNNCRVLPETDTFGPRDNYDNIRSSWQTIFDIVGQK